MNGTAEQTFGPHETASRAMLATILYRLAGSPPDHWGKRRVHRRPRRPVVQRAARQELTNSYDGGLFGPNDPVTREQLAAILYRYAGSPEAEGSLENFVDAELAAGWATDALRWAVAQGILLGNADGRLDPQGNAARAEVAAMMMRFLQ